VPPKFRSSRVKSLSCAVIVRANMVQKKHRAAMAPLLVLVFIIVETVTF